MNPYIGDWICDVCHHKMDVTKENRRRYLIHCPNCGTEWYVDAHGEYINDDTGDSDDDYDEDFELANFCHGGDLLED